MLRNIQKHEENNKNIVFLCISIARLLQHQCAQSGLLLDGRKHCAQCIRSIRRSQQKLCPTPLAPSGHLKRDKHITKRMKFLHMSSAWLLWRTNGRLKSLHTACGAFEAPRSLRPMHPEPLGRLNIFQHGGSNWAQPKLWHTF